MSPIETYLSTSFVFDESPSGQLMDTDGVVVLSFKRGDGCGRKAPSSGKNVFATHANGNHISIL